MSFHQYTVPEITQVLLLETRDGLILVDAGLGLDDFNHPSPVEWLVMRLTGVFATPAETPIRQVTALGLNPRDVRDIVPTHLHFDHIGGALDFPWAKIHVWDAELAAGLRPSGLLGLASYYPARWKNHPGLTPHTLDNGSWFGLPALPVIQRPDVEIWLVPLTGHSPGHCGVAIRAASGWLWHCGDAYTRQMQVDPVNPRPAFPAIGRALEETMFPGPALQKIRQVLSAHGDEVTAICAHDPEIFRQMQAREW
jgi:glyoxylase-like metal-dependent hydrolase (beta-lactamase superfamily II)